MLTELNGRELLVCRYYFNCLNPWTFVRVRELDRNYPGTIAWPRPACSDFMMMMAMMPTMMMKTDRKAASPERTLRLLWIVYSLFANYMRNYRWRFIFVHEHKKLVLNLKLSFETFNFLMMINFYIQLRLGSFINFVYLMMSVDVWKFGYILTMLFRVYLHWFIFIVVFVNDLSS